MHRFAWIILIFCFVLPATAAQTAELEGFGPIKFGMTTEEARAAMGGKGEWPIESLLIYESAFDRGTIPLKVYQGFGESGITKGRAVEATVVYQTPKGGPETSDSCRERTLIMAGLIREKYNKDPLVQYGIETRAGRPNKTIISITDIFIFNFSEGAYIKINSRLNVMRERKDCLILTIYRPPTDAEIPF